MFTKEKHISKAGDCIVGVATDKAAADLSLEFKEKLKKPNAKLTIIVEAGGIVEQIQAFGSRGLVLTHPTDAVVRKSDYQSTRTLAVHANKAADDLSRELVKKLENPNQKVKITLTVRA